VVLNVKPAGDKAAIAVNRQFFSLDRIQNHQGNVFLRELARTVIVGTISGNGWQLVRRLPGTHQMVAGGLAGRIGRTRVVSRVLEKWPVARWTDFSEIRAGSAAAAYSRPD
jgi:hypothetical protein